MNSKPENTKMNGTNGKFAAVEIIAKTEFTR